MVIAIAVAVECESNEFLEEAFGGCIIYVSRYSLFLWNIFFCAKVVNGCLWCKTSQWFHAQSSVPESSKLVRCPYGINQSFCFCSSVVVVVVAGIWSLVWLLRQRFRLSCKPIVGWEQCESFAFVSIKVYGLLNKWNYACAVIVLLFDYALSVIISSSPYSFSFAFLHAATNWTNFFFRKKSRCSQRTLFFSRVLRRFFIANVFFCFVFMNKSVFYMYLLFWLWICGIGSSILVLNLILPFFVCPVFRKCGCVRLWVHFTDAILCDECVNIVRYDRCDDRVNLSFASHL